MDVKEIVHILFKGYSLFSATWEYFEVLDLWLKIKKKNKQWVWTFYLF